MISSSETNADNSGRYWHSNRLIERSTCLVITPYCYREIQTDVIKNYKSLFVHGSVVDIMAIQIHFRYISMITLFFFPIKQTFESDMSW